MSSLLIEWRHSTHWVVSLTCVPATYVPPRLFATVELFFFHAIQQKCISTMEMRSNLGIARGNLSDVQALRFSLQDTNVFCMKNRILISFLNEKKKNKIKACIPPTPFPSCSAPFSSSHRSVDLDGEKTPDDTNTRVRSRTPPWALAQVPDWAHPSFYFLHWRRKRPFKKKKRAVLITWRPQLEASRLKRHDNERFIFYNHVNSVEQTWLCWDGRRKIKKRLCSSSHRFKMNPQLRAATYGIDVVHAKSVPDYPVWNQRRWMG